MHYTKGDSGTRYLRVISCSGAERICSMGTDLKSTADAIEGWVKSLRNRLDPHGILDAIVAPKGSLVRLELVDAYRLGEEGARDELKARRAAADDLDLRPLLDEFVAWRAERSKGHTMIDRYVSQLLRLWPEDVWLRSAWTAQEHADRLDRMTGLKDATRNRYRAAVSSFCKYLVRKGHIPFNPIRQFEGFAESPAKEIWYAVPDAQRIMRALAAKHRIRELLMAGAGMDWTDCAKLRRRDLVSVQLNGHETYEIRCHGSKTSHRNRVIYLTERWTVPMVRELIADLLPDAPVCPPVTHNNAMKWHRVALTACDLPDSTLHNWRHHYTVHAFKRGEKAHVIANQLGKANIKDLIERYGKYAPDASEYVATDELGAARRTLTLAATHSATHGGRSA